MRPCPVTVTMPQRCCGPTANRWPAKAHSIAWSTRRGGMRSKYHKIDCDDAQVDALLVDLFLEAHERAPREIVLDLDNTDIPLHGEQEILPRLPLGRPRRTPSPGWPQRTSGRICASRTHWPPAWRAPSPPRRRPSRSQFRPWSGAGRDGVMVMSAFISTRLKQAERRAGRTQWRR